MDDMPDFASGSKEKLRWYIENFPSPHPFFAPAMAALEEKEAEENKHTMNQAGIHIETSNIGIVNLGSQVGEIAAHAIGPTAVEFQEYLRQMFRVAELEWSLLNKPGKRVTAQMVCKQVDDLRAALAMLYGKCPNGVDSQPLRDAIEKLDETKEYRLGPLIGSQQMMNKVCELMDAALAGIRAMVSEVVGGEPE
jgi:hypothetical protein